ncbi:MAG: lysophospholipid acyltransferase family protein [Anaerolineaceae bacterium]
MNLQSIINSRVGVGSALLFGQLMPRFIGYPLARTVANLLSFRKNGVLVSAMRVNQWVVHDGALSTDQLNKIVSDVFINSSKAIYDLYHNLHNPKAINKLAEYSESFSRMYESYQEGKRGYIITAPHLGSFDIGGLALGLRNVSFQTLSYPNPGNGYQLQNYFREKYGLYITPMSVSSMREAEQRLRDGGMVLTGLDRPLAGSRYRPKFFGRPAALPVSYIPMAIKTGVPVVVVSCYYDGEKYILDASEPVEMKSYPDRQEEIERNAERVLLEAERMIRAHPDQWFMYYPVWPELLGTIE